MRRRLGVGLITLATFIAGAALGTGQVRADTPAPSPSANATAAATPTPTPIPHGQLCAHLPINMPPTLDGLPVSREESCTDLGSVAHPSAVDAITLYSLRRSDKLLLATLQVSRFAPQVDASSPSVQASIVTQLSPTIPAMVRVGGTIVYHAQTSTVTLLSWFRGRYLFVLAIRDLVGRPRTLLREALEIKP